MVDIAPKALRFARLAAEQLPAYSSNPQVAVMRRQEEKFGRKPINERIRQYIRISKKTANFCVVVMTTFIDNEDRFKSSNWDGNDFIFLQAATTSLREQLERSKFSAG